MRIPYLTLLVCGGVVASLTGCITAPPFAPGRLIPPTDSAALCSSLNASREKISAFRTLLNATVSGPDNEAVSFRYAVVGKSDKKLRIDVLPQEGAYTLALITVRGTDALLLDTQAKRATEGCSVGEILERFLGFEGMTPAAVQALVLGQVPALECSRVAVYRPKEGRVLFLDRAARLAWEVDEASGELAQVHVLDSAATAVTALARRQQENGGVVIVVDIHKPVHASAEMRVTKFTKNPEVSDELFEIPVPAGYAREGC